MQRQNSSSLLKRMARDWIRSFGWEVTRYRRDGGTGRFFENLVRKRFDPRLIVDVGANRGAWTRLAARYFPLAEFVLVEPQESMRVYLEALCHDIPRVRWMNVAAGETTTQTSMNVCMDPTHSSLLDKPQLISPGDEVVMRQEIEVLPLASMCNDIPSFVKIDTEGFEMPVLKGFGKLMGKVEVLLLELALTPPWENSASFSEIVSYLHEYHYRVFEIVDKISTRDDGLTMQVDVAFCRNDSTLIR